MCSSNRAAATAADPRGPIRRGQQKMLWCLKVVCRKPFVSSPPPCCVIASTSVCQQNLCCRSNSKDLPCDHIETRLVTVNKSITHSTFQTLCWCLFIYFFSILTLLNIFTWWHQSRRWLGLTLATHAHTHTRLPPGLTSYCVWQWPPQSCLPVASSFFQPNVMSVTSRRPSAEPDHTHVLSCNVRTLTSRKKICLEWTFGVATQTLQVGGNEKWLQLLSSLRCSEVCVFTLKLKILFNPVHFV